MQNTNLTYADVERAYGRIRGTIHRTPILTCTALNEMLHAQIYFKCENFQRAGAFKFRGASNAVLALSEAEAARGVATHSSGNHGQALALAARLRGIPAHVVMPSNSSTVKKAAVEQYGAKITYCEPTLAAREKTLNEIVAQTGAHFVHPYDDRFVIAGQGTAALELLQEVSDLDLIMTPVGGGGLLGGTALTAKTKPGVEVFGAEPEIANDAFQSFTSGQLHPTHNAPTIADGLRGSLSELTLSIIKAQVDDILLAKEASIKRAFWLVLERMKIVIEPSAAVSIAALFDSPSRAQGRRIGIVLSGGNVDMPPKF